MMLIGKCTKHLKFLLQLAIAQKNQDESKKNHIIDCISSLEKDIQGSDQTLDLITKEIKV